MLRGNSWLCLQVQLWSPLSGGRVASSSAFRTLISGPSLLLPQWFFNTFCETISNRPKYLTGTLQMIFLSSRTWEWAVDRYLIVPRYFLVYLLHIRTYFPMITSTRITTQPGTQEVSIAVLWPPNTHTWFKFHESSSSFIAKRYSSGSYVIFLLFYLLVSFSLVFPTLFLKPVLGDLSSPLGIRHQTQSHTPPWMSSSLLLVSGTLPMSWATVALATSLVGSPTLLSPVYYLLH